MLEFSLKGYSELLSTLKDRGYSFCGFEDVGPCMIEEKPFVILRHDIDISLRPALEIARIEYDQRVQATYFVCHRSPFYNILSRSNAELMLQIHEYGHQIAVHLDLAVYDNDCARALKEVEVLSKFYSYLNTQLVSLHSSYDLHHMPVELFQQIHSVYGPVVRGEMAYISDSTGRWRYGHPLVSEAFCLRKPIQLLTHPIWWFQEGKTAPEKLRNWFYRDYLDNFENVHEFLPKLFKANKL